jgi:lipoate-protein ligase A
MEAAAGKRPRLRSSTIPRPTRRDYWQRNNVRLGGNRVPALYLLDFSCADVHENLALDEALLAEAEAGAGGELLRFWQQADYAVVLGAGAALHDDVDLQNCAADGVPVARRVSGGGTVLLGPGCLCFSLILDLSRREDLRGVRTSYRCILERCAQALSPMPGAPGEPAALAGSSDLALAARKVSGNAQRRGRRFLLHQGTLLYDFDLARVSRFLLEPGNQPAYRAGRPHAEFLANLPLGLEELKARLARAWDAGQAPARLPRENAQRLAATKYRTAAWIRRR